MISRDDWLNALHALEPACEPDALTRRELANLFGLKPSATKERIRKMVENGAARLTRKRVADTSGRPQVVPAYALVKPLRRKRR